MGSTSNVQKYFAIKDEKSIFTATIFSTIFALILSGGAYLVGNLSQLFFNNIPIDPTTNKAKAD